MSYLDDSTPEARPPLDATPEPSRSGMSGCAKGCLIAFVIFLLLLIAAVIAAVVYLRQIAGVVMNWIAVSVVEALPLPAEDIAEGKVVVVDLVDAWEDERLTMFELGTSLDALKDKPNVLALALSVVAFEDIKTWNDPTATTPSVGSPLGQSGLSPDERQRFIAAAHRFVAATEAGGVAGENYDEFWSALTPQGGSRGQQQLSDEQLRHVVRLLEQVAEDTDAPERDSAHPTEGVADVLNELKNLRDRVQ